MSAQQVAIQGKITDESGRPYVYVTDASTWSGQTPYRGGSTGTRAGALWSTSAGSADADIEQTHEGVRNRSRDQIRNNPIARSTLVTLDSNVIGEGLTLNPEIDAEMLGISEDEADSVGHRIQSVWQIWSESKESDSTNMLTFRQQQRLAYWSSRDSGDVLTLLVGFDRGEFPFRTRVQLVEADRISTPPSEISNPRVSMGVERDGNNAPLRYHVRRNHPGDIFRLNRPITDTLTWDPIPAFGRRTGRKVAWLTYSIHRPGQSRGVPYIAVGLEQLKQLDRYQEQELMAAIVGGSVTVVIKSGETGYSRLLAAPPVAGSPPIGQRADDLAIGYGGSMFLEPGQDYGVVNPNRPNTAYADFVRANCESFGAGVGIPVEVLLKRFSTSFSAATAAKQEAGKVFLQERNDFATDWIQPIYETVMTEAVLIGMLDLPGFLENPLAKRAYLRATWQGPAFGAMREFDAVRSAQARIDGGLSTKQIEIPRLIGRTADDVTRQRRREIEQETI